jgi:hypothetical protein
MEKETRLDTSRENFLTPEIGSNTGERITEFLPPQCFSIRIYFRR